MAEWLVMRAPELGCRYDVFDLERPATDEAGGVLRAAALIRQGRLLVRYLRWMRRSPRLTHYMVSLTRTGLVRDALFVHVAALAGRDVIAHVHGADVPHIRPESVRARLLRAIRRRSVACVTLAPSLAEGLQKLGVEAEVIWNPVRLRQEPRASRPDDGSLRLLFVGTFGARKGCPELLQALARVRERGMDVTLRLVGKEEHHGEESELRDLVRVLGLEGTVMFDGVISPDRLPAIYASADVFVLPSKREGLPVALLEAMSAGLPPLTTPVGGIPDLVQDDVSGIVVRPGDVDDLAVALSRLSTEGDLRSRLGESARERVSSLAGDERVAGAWGNIYRRLS